MVLRQCRSQVRPRPSGWPLPPSPSVAAAPAGLLPSAASAVCASPRCERGRRGGLWRRGLGTRVRRPGTLPPAHGTKEAQIGRVGYHHGVPLRSSERAGGSSTDGFKGRRPCHRPQAKANLPTLDPLSVATQSARSTSQVLTLWSHDDVTAVAAPPPPSQATFFLKGGAVKKTVKETVKETI